MDLFSYIKNKWYQEKRGPRNFNIALRECEEFIDQLVDVAEREEMEYGSPGINPHAIDFMEDREEDSELPPEYTRLSIEGRLQIIYENLKMERDNIIIDAKSPNSVYVATPEYRRDLNLLIGSITLFRRNSEYFLSKLSGWTTAERMENFADKLRHNVLYRMYRFRDKYDTPYKRRYIKNLDKVKLTEKEIQRLNLHDPDSVTTFGTDED